MSVEEKIITSSTSALASLNLNNSTSSNNNNAAVIEPRRASRKLPPNVNDEILKNFRRFSNASGGGEMSPIHTSNSSSMSELGASTTRLADQIKLRRFF